MTGAVLRGSWSFVLVLDFSTELAFENEEEDEDDYEGGFATKENSSLPPSRRSPQDHRRGAINSNSTRA